MDNACCMSHVACCVLHAVRPLLHVACCHRSRQFRRVCTRARNVHARTLLSVWPWPMKAVGRTPLVICAFTLHWPQLPEHRLCTAAAPHPSLRSSVGLQLEQIATTGTEKALLADVTEAHPDASYAELLRLFNVRRSVADAHS